MMLEMLRRRNGSVCGTLPAQVTTKAESTIEFMLKTPDATVICRRKTLNEAEAGDTNFHS